MNFIKLKKKNAFLANELSLLTVENEWNEWMPNVEWI